MPSVLIVGGGLVGLTAALCLEYHGVDYVLVERNTEPTVLPRSRGMHTRAVEIFRQIGVEDAVQAASASALKMGRFGGARTGRSIVESEALDLRHVYATGAMVGVDESPSGFCFCPQVLLEPVLRDLAEQRGGDIRFGTELTAFTQDDDQVVATLTDVTTGHVETLRADYLLAADGAGSPVRTTLGITSTTRPATHHYLNVYFRADLTDVVRDRTFSQCEIDGPEVSGLFLAKNNTDEWSFHLAYDPEREHPRDYPDDRCVALLRTAIGIDDPELRVDLLARGAWDTGTAVADAYRSGRAFLAGDAAHRHAPWGGFGANTGIADVHNLAWKLAAVLRGQASDALLDTYEPERRPRGVLVAEQAWLRTDFLARYGIRTPGNAEALARQLGTGEIMTRYRYASSAVHGAPAGDTVEELTGQTGTRVPHHWLERDGIRLSTLDLCGPAYVLLVGEDAGVWADAAEGVPVAVRAVENEAEFWSALGMDAGGALLVRPDGFVAARSDDGLTPEGLPQTLNRLNSL
ncbi:FAD-dependent monooxygenase [Streptomyces sp. NBC_00083]|uniref:FAD-dependent monooxygenase n=1 Tax=Streptomyces sp. NBC_00083 TaxID=2975647 RepID=UPI00225741DE|nr:FAD-dependent monooxygenase [Streptomyces sp. NBC_00083]MCX5383905.1 FAD-dependent monooxygenase [Streptomyces sp. NBC_00083]